MKLDPVRPSLKACISPGIHVGGNNRGAHQYERGYAARWSKSAHLNARRGISQHYCDLDEILWRCDLDDEATRLIEDGKQLTKVLSVHKANPVCIPIISREQIGANNLIPNAVEIAAA